MHIQLLIVPLMLSFFIAVFSFVDTAFCMLTGRKCTQAFLTCVISALIFFPIADIYNKSFNEAITVVAKISVPKASIHEFDENGKKIYFVVENTDSNNKLTCTNLSEQIPDMTQNTPIVRLKYKGKGFGFDYSDVLKPTYEVASQRLLTPEGLGR